MKTMELLVSLDNVKDAYVIGAEDFRQGRQGKRLSVKRVWLIAAAVALMLLLVGCAVVYMLRMQDLTVGEWKDDVPVVFDENGNRIPIETREPTILLSLQNTNMEALAEWVEFTENYDKDHTVMSAADVRSRHSLCSQRHIPTHPRRRCLPRHSSGRHRSGLP